MTQSMSHRIWLLQGQRALKQVVIIFSEPTNSLSFNMMNGNFFFFFLEILLLRALAARTFVSKHLQ